MLQAERSVVGFVLVLGLVFSVQAEDLRAFPNGDYEDQSKFGCTGRLERARGLGVNGNGGLRITGSDRYVYVLPIRPGIKLAQGARYAFSLDVRNSSDGRRVPGGRIADQIALEVYDRQTGAFRESYYGCKFGDANDGWRRERLEFVPRCDLDSDKDDLRFFLLIETMPEKPSSPPPEMSWVACDNATLETTDPLWLFCNTWPTHNRIWKEKGWVRAHSTFVGPYLPAGAKPSYRIELSSTNGVLLSSAEALETNGVLRADLGPLDYDGPATLTAVLFSSGKEIARQARQVTVAPRYVPKSGEVEATAKGVARIDGKPFMPIGFFTHFGNRNAHSREDVDRRLSELHDAGFNLILDYCSFYLQGEEREAFYGMCQRHGIRVIVNDFSGLYRNSAELAAADAKVKELARFPAVLGWYMMDEAREGYVPAIERVRRFLNDMTPGHLTYACNIFAPAPYLPCSDVQGGDEYPIRAGGGTLAKANAKIAAEAACRPALAWFVPQAFNWGNYAHGTDALTNRETYQKRGREPQENEILAITLLYASHGVTGFIFYSYYDMFRGPCPELYEGRWQAMKNIAASLRELEPFITSGRGIAELPHIDRENPVRLVRMSDGKGRMAVLAIGLGERHETHFRVPGANCDLKSRCGHVEREGNDYVFRGKAISCDYLIGEE